MIPHNLEAETAVLGALLLGTDGSRPLQGLLVDEQLRAEHFYRPDHQRIFTAMCSLLKKGEPIDSLTVQNELDVLNNPQGKAYVATLQALCVAAGNYRHYAKLVIEAADRRRKLQAGRLIQEGAQENDLGKIAEGEWLLNAHETRSERPSMEQRQEAMVAYLESDDEDWWAVPFPRLADLLAGGWRPGQLTILGGLRSHGKSVVADQCLEHVTLRGVKGALYLNEMAVLERDQRTLARQANVPFSGILRKTLDKDQLAKCFRAVNQGFGFEVVPAYGWSADTVSHDVKRSGWRFVVLDLLNGLPGSHDTEGIDQNVRVLRDCAMQTGAHILATNHLNRGRDTGEYPPEPTLRDLRGSGQIADLANNVLFIHRKQSVDEPGQPGDEAVLNLAKAHNGELGRVQLLFQGRRMRFGEPLRAVV